MKKLIPIIILISIIACKHKQIRHFSDRTDENTLSFYKNKDEKLIVYKLDDSSAFFRYSDLLCKNTVCPDIMLWGKLEYCTQNETVIVDSEFIVSSYKNDWISPFIYEYWTLPFPKKDINDSVANLICNLPLDRSPGFMPLDYNTKKKEIVHYVNSDLKETGLNTIHRESLYDVTDSAGIYVNNTNKNDTLFLLDILISRDISFMKKNKKSISSTKIKKYIDYINELELLNSGYKDDLLELFKTINKYGTKEEKSILYRTNNRR